MSFCFVQHCYAIWRQIKDLRKQKKANISIQKPYLSCFILLFLLIRREQKTEISVLLSSAKFIVQQLITTKKSLTIFTNYVSLSVCIYILSNNCVVVKCVWFHCCCYCGCLPCVIRIIFFFFLFLVLVVLGTY